MYEALFLVYVPSNRVYYKYIPGVCLAPWLENDILDFRINSATG